MSQRVVVEYKGSSAKGGTYKWVVEWWMTFLPGRCIVLECHVKGFVAGEEESGLCVVFSGSHHSLR